MLELITSEGNVPIHDVENNYAITHKWNGIDTLHFELYLDDPAFPQLAEEAYIYETTEEQTYVIKGIDAGSSTADVDCQLNLEAWQSTAVFYYYNNTSSLPVTMQQVVPSGWSMVYETMDTQRRSVLLDAGGTPLDIALTAQDSYGCAMRFDTGRHICTVYYPQANPISGTLLTESAAMRRRPSRTGKSTDLVTRVYPIGVNGLTIGHINGGRDYVENLRYTDKIICKVWKDERYENSISLRSAAQALVDSLATPEVSWEVSLFDLYRSDPQRWSDHKVELYQRVQVAYNGSTITALIAEEEIHPYHPENNTVAVNSVPRNSINTISGLKDEIQNPNSDFNAKRDAAIQNATQLIAGSHGGRVVLVQDEDGKPIELCILSDSEDLATARSLWRWNEGGLGHSDTGYNGPFSLAITKDGAIVADRITVGTLNAGLIKAGVLTDDRGKNFWNMETGEFSTSGTISSYDSPDGTLSGYLGYMTGATESGTTSGIGVGNASGDCYAIATGSGIRLQAGDYSVYVTKTGVAKLTGKAGSVLITSSGDKGAGVYITGRLFRRGSEGDEWTNIS